MSDTWVDRDGWTRRIDDEGRAWRWEGEARGWVRTPERDVEGGK